MKLTMIKLRILFVILFTSLVSGNLFAQSSSSVELSNIMVTVASKDTMQEFQVYLDLKNYEQIDSLFVLFGSEKGSGDIRSFKGKSKFYRESQKNAFDFGQGIYPLVYSSSVRFKHLFSVNNFINFVTVYCKDKNQNYSEKLYYLIP